MRLRPRRAHVRTASAAGANASCSRAGYVLSCLLAQAFATLVRERTQIEIVHDVLPTKKPPLCGGHGDQSCARALRRGVGPQTIGANATAEHPATRATVGSLRHSRHQFHGCSFLSKWGLRTVRLLLRYHARRPRVNRRGSRYSAPRECPAWPSWCPTACCSEHRFQTDAVRSESAAASR